MGVKKHIMHFFISCLLLMNINAFAQNDSLSNAVKYLQSGTLDRAKIAIDAAAVHPGTAKDAQTWYYRGYIYKEISKKSADGVKFRTEALNSFKKSMELDKDKALYEDNRANIKYIGSKFFNDAGVNLTPDNFKLALEYFEKFKECMLIYDPAMDLKSRENEFKLALSSVYTNIYDSDKKQHSSYLALIKQQLDEVIKSDPNNLIGNYNLGLFYYNQAVNIINDMDYDMDIIALSQIQDNTIVLFKEALPYMQIAYKLNPKRKETLIALQGIYFSLNEFDKSNEMKRQLEQIK
jgi:tetratricopeptide (TPR) repeat protein